MAAVDYYAITQQVYISYFGRPADPRGLEAFAAVLDSAKAPTDFVKFNEFYKTNASVKALVDSFGTSTESNTLYGSSDTDTFINSIFVNVLGRPAKLAGLNYWNTQITSGKVTKAGAALAIMAGAYANTTDPVQAAIDQAVINNKVTVATSFTTNIDTVEELIAYKGAAAAGVARTMLQTVTNTTDTSAFNTTVNATLANLVTAVADATGKTFALTANTDAVIGTSGNDTITSAYDITSTKNTLTGLDSINGGAGTDTLAITQATGAFTLNAASGVTVSNVENLTVAGIGAVTVDTTAASITGLTSVKVTQSAAATVTAGATTDVTVSGATGAVAVDGGKAVAVTATGAAQTVVVGATTLAAGAVSVTHTNQTTADIEVDGGAAITVTAGNVTTGDVLVGQNTAAKGAVTVATTGADYASAAATRGAIVVDGGTTVSVTQVPTASATAAATNAANIGNEITQGTVDINGTADTTAVTVIQAAPVTGVDAVTAVTGVKEVQTVSFVAMAAGETITVNGLTFTASKALTAAQAAAAFSNVANGGSFGGAAAGNGIYSGTFSTLAGSTGAVTTTATDSTVTFTGSSNGNLAALTVSDSAAAGNVAATTVTNGVTAVAAKTGVLGVIGGDVDVSGAKIATATLTGFGVGSSVVSDALTSLTLASSNADVTITNSAPAALALSVNAVGVTGTHGVVTAAGYTTVNLTATGAGSFVNLVDNAATTLTVAGDKVVDLTGSTLNGLTTVTVSGSAGVTFDNDEADTITSFNASATSGAVTASVNADNATYAGGSGVDTVQLVTSTVVDKAISLGAGDDVLKLVSGTTALAADVNGDAGSDTLYMEAADAATASGTAIFETKITSFEKLSLGAVASGASATVDLANMDDISYVISANTGSGGEVQTFTVNGGTSAAVGEVQTFTVTAASPTDAADVTIGGVVVDITAGDSIDTIGAKIEAAEAAIKAANTNVAAVSYNGVTNTVTVTYNGAAGNVADITLVNANAEATFSGITTATVGDSNAGNITVAGAAVALTAGMTADQVGAAIAAAQAAIIAATPAVSTVTYNSTTDTVSITYSGTSNQPAVTVSDAPGNVGATFGAVVDNAVAAGGSASALTLTNMANAGTLELNAAGAGATVTLKDATGTADSFNIVTKVDGSNLGFGTVAVAGAETVNVNATDASTSTINTATLKLSDAAVKSMVLTGNANLTLTLDTGIVALTTIDGSAMTGKLVASTNGTVATVLKGGAGADTLTSVFTGDTLQGGAGNDTLIVTGDLAILTGGAGNDTFNVGDTTTNVNSYATITDLAAGDSIKFSAGASDFLNAKVTLADTAVFQDYANAAINLTDGGDVAWFQFGGNTYVIENTSNGASFLNGTDAIVKITGTIDLTNSAFSSSTDTLYIV